MAAISPSRRAAETYTVKDLADAYREGWKRRDRSISVIQATTARDEVYGESRRLKATVRPLKYHASMFTAWMKDRDQ